MQRRWAFIGLGLVVFVGSLLLTAPAQQVYRLIADEIPARAWGVRGSLWQGQASTVMAAGVRVDQLRWRLDPLELGAAQLLYDVSGVIADGDFSARIATRTGEYVRLTNARANIGADAAVRAVGGSDYPATLQGRLDAFIQQVTIEGARPRQVDGVVNWNNARVSMAGTSIALGSFAVRLSTDDDGAVVGAVRNTEPGPLEVRGEVELLANGTVTGMIELTTTDSASEELLQGMRMIGIPDPKEEVEIRFEGDFDDPAGFRGYLE